MNSLLYSKGYYSVAKLHDGLLGSGYAYSIPRWSPACYWNQCRFFLHRSKMYPVVKRMKLDWVKLDYFYRAMQSNNAPNKGELSESDEEDKLCPVDCVREFKTQEEFSRILEKAKETNALVVVDFFRTSCGSCKYIEQGFAKLCKGSGDQDTSVIFLKHNVIDEYDEQSEVAEQLRIRAVPLFHFYKNGVLLEAFATRDKDRIDAAISKFMSPSQDV
ncbi:hypothetical protein QJS04_geneDACA021713 [Acorus gramineus]|uniref:Thioredoxin domain-containing protein n=1 Tax=Acorus gramineus TaxID=55184 RepID=A0AAV9AFM2_ACOGR|nr:hypothetical protein QJS04_geneDACA021713 [Acorus gramineus]